jgi:hypothetical protein
MSTATDNLINSAGFLKEIAQIIDKRCLIVPEHNLTLTLNYDLIQQLNLSMASNPWDKSETFLLETTDLESLDVSEIELGLMLTEFYDHVKDLGNCNALIKLIKARNSKLDKCKIAAIYVEDRDNALLFFDNVYAFYYTSHEFNLTLSVNKSTYKLNKKILAIVLTDGGVYFRAQV